MGNGIVLALALGVVGLATTAAAQTSPPRPGGPGFNGVGGFGTGARNDTSELGNWENVPAAQEPFTERLSRHLAKRPTPAALADIAAGSEVRDRNVALIGRIVSVNGTAALVRHGGDNIVPVPLSAFWKLDGHLVLPVTRNDFDRIAGQYAARTEDEATDDQAE